MSSLWSGKGIENGPDGDGVGSSPSGCPVHWRPLEPVERASRAEGVRAHLAPPDPIADNHALRESDHLTNAVDRVARRTPDRGLLSVLVPQLNGEVDGEVDVRRRGERRDGVRWRMGDGEWVRMHDLVVEHDAVEGPVDAVVDIV
jgi:hypothetical protein